MLASEGTIMSNNPRPASPRERTSIRSGAYRATTSRAVSLRAARDLFRLLARFIPFMVVAFLCGSDSDDSDITGAPRASPP